MNSWINPHQSFLFSSSSFCGEESLARTKKEAASKDVILQAVSRIGQKPDAMVSREVFSGKKEQECHERFLQSALCNVATTLEASVEPNWKADNLTEIDQKTLSALWRSLSVEECERFCPNGQWRWSSEGNPLHLLTLAIEKGRLDAAEVLLKTCFRDQSSDDQKKAVAECISLKHVEGSYLLIKNGFPLVDRDLLAQADQVGRTLAWFGASDGNADILTELISQNINVDMPDQYGWTPLLAACNGGKLLSVKALASVKTELNVEAMDAAGWMPIHRACLHGHVDVARELVVEMATKADIPDHLGRTPLHRAVERNRVEVVRFLCDNCKVNPDYAGYVEGYTSPISARDLAKDRKQTEICRIFEDYSL